MTDFPAFFRAATRSDAHPKGLAPRPYQSRLAKSPWPETLIIPTGFGKTAAVLAAWLWKRKQGDAHALRRLVYCLPMRTLVEQTEQVAQVWTKAAKEQFNLDVSVHVLMGGVEPGPKRRAPDWIMSPERPAILIGTQDMLVSAALMRCYGTTRYRWPVDFALLHNDAMWVFDEVQLAGASLPTSAQMEAFRRALKVALPSRTLWMSATLDPAWLKTVDFTSADSARKPDLDPEDLSQADHLWKAKKRLAKADIDAKDISKPKNMLSYARSLAALARERTHAGKTTIIFLNTVARAQAVYDALPAADSPRLLLHSRFRGEDRKKKTDQALSEPPAAGRTIVTTQALEAGVDITSSILITELAPWSSLVQRIGRCNRNGECDDAGADVFWIDLPDDAAPPYAPNDFADARAKLAGLAQCGPETLSAIAPSAPPPSHVLRRRDLLDLFDTEPDLSGFDLDVSLYVRDADDTDVRLFWRVVPEGGPNRETAAPVREELCPAPIGGAKELVKRKDVRAWRWDALDKAWAKARADELRPGMEIMVDAASGGYDNERGFDPASTRAVEPRENDGDAQRAIDGDEDTESKVRVSLAKHSAHVRDNAEILCEALKVGEPERSIVIEAALWHDLGKAHAAFVALTHGAGAPPPETPLAKWPPLKPRPASLRPFYRHELASALGYLAAKDWSPDASLAAYLIAAHHGKVRTRIAALPTEKPAPEGRLFARGVWNGDLLPTTQLAEITTPELTLDLDIMQLGEGAHGPSWTARTQMLLEHYGPFRLAWLEALVRIADWRASRDEDKADHDDV